MKKKIFSLLFGLLTLTSTQSSAVTMGDYEFDDFEEDFVALKYVKLGSRTLGAGRTNTFVPAISFGRRFECPDVGVDYSASFGYAKGIGGCDRSSIFYSVPRIVCITFINECANSSLYYGGGASFGGIINNNTHSQYHGLLAEGALGYEMQRFSCVRSFMEFDFSVPILAAYRKGKYPGPTVQLAFALCY
ncbi:MAG: hypothetical protein VX777_03600 [Chlamydiota bacterium]|nr:hypothetical protein [Chlamydiota bacterium]